VSAASFVLFVIGGFLLMEPLTAATHRWVMHGVGEWFHRSHHRPGRTSGWERNDWFPVAFASIVMFGFWAGFNTSLVALVPLGIGVTLYGIAYALVHDGYIHRRLDMFGSRRIATLERLADAHRIHHLYNAAPYGMLAPIVPAELRERAAATDRDPFAPVARPVSTTPA
jgi:beta-carotene 3-hydroxylase